MIDRSIRLLASVLGLFAVAATPAQVYKCPGAGGSVYQSAPCANAPKAAPYIAKPADPAPQVVPVQPLPLGDLAAMDLPTIQRALLAIDAERAHANSDYRAEQLEWQKSAGKQDPQERMRQQNAIGNRLQLRKRQIDAYERQLTGELTRRCPGGISNTAAGIDCRK